MHSVTRSTLSVFALVLLLGCDGNTPPPEDAGVVDAGPPDAGPPLACADPTAVTGMLDGTVSLMLDTTMTSTRPRDLGLTCGNNESELRWAPQQVLELQIPGTGDVAVDLDTVFPETPTSFNTVLQVRRTCEEAPLARFPPTCFDDGNMEFRSRGSFPATGGETLYLFVTGYSEPPAEQMTMDSGPVRLDITVRSNQLPTITQADFVLAFNDTRVRVTGSDADGDAAGVVLSFYGADGALLDIYGDGVATPESSVFAVPFQPTPGSVDFTADAIVPGAAIALAGYLREVGARQAGVRVYDSASAVSDMLMVNIVEAEQVGFGDACDFDTACRPEMICDEGGTDTCAPSSEIQSLCDRARPITIDPPMGTATTGEISGSSGAGVGLISVQCANYAQGDGSIGAEAAYRVSVPTGTYDLIATTNVSASAGQDTILYARSTCFDSSTELACNDDRAGGGLTSDIEVRDVTEGDYFLFVESFGGTGSGSVPHGLSVTLRPVLATGEPCDSSGEQNRCASGSCSSGTCP